MKKFVITEEEKDDILGKYKTKSSENAKLSEKLSQYYILKDEVVNLLIQELANSIVIPILMSNQKLGNFYIGHGTYYFRKKNNDIIYNDDYDSKVRNFILKYDNYGEFGIESSGVTINRDGIERE